MMTPANKMQALKAAEILGLEVNPKHKSYKVACRRAGQSKWREFIPLHDLEDWVKEQGTAMNIVYHKDAPTEERWTCAVNMALAEAPNAHGKGVNLCSAICEAIIKGRDGFKTIADGKEKTDDQNA